MKIPKRLIPLLEDGLIDDVIRQLMSGKEATVFVVRCGDEVRCAKVYKEANKRSFRQSVEYTENRKVKNSRMARAMAKGSRYGREAQEAAWQNAEVDALYRLAAAGVCVPKPYNFHEGVLLMELVTDAAGNAAPRLNDVAFTPAEAHEHFHALLRQVVLMLCAGVIHGDLSEYNILLGEHGPVIIDLPQAVDAAGNNHAQSLLVRDVNNLTQYFANFVPELLQTQYGNEIWALYEQGELLPNSALTGIFVGKDTPIDLHAVMREIDDARAEEAARQLRMLEARLPQKNID
jgi:RIO kinase 1